MPGPDFFAENSAPASAASARHVADYDLVPLRRPPARAELEAAARAEAFRASRKADRRPRRRLAPDPLHSPPPPRTAPPPAAPPASR